MRLGFRIVFFLCLADLLAVPGRAQATEARALRAGFTLPAPDAADLEKRTDDEAAHVQLIGYYSHQPPGPEVERHRVAHVLWMVDNRPESLLFELATPAWKIFRQGDDTAAFDRARKLWVDHLAQGSKLVKLHAAAFLQLGDAGQAAELYRAVGQMRGVGTTYAYYLLGVTELDPISGDPAAADESQRDTELGRKMVEELRASKDPEFVGGAGSALAIFGAMLYSESRTNWDYSTLAAELLKTAQAHDKRNVEWFAVPTALPERGSITPKVLRVDWEQVKGALTERAVPLYPSLARQRRIMGTVLVNIAIGTDGTVLKSVLAGDAAELSTGVAETVALWKFKPIRIGKRPVIVVTSTPIRFTLNSGPPGF